MGLDMKRRKMTRKRSGAGGKRPGAGAAGGGASSPGEPLWLYGRHAVMAALRNHRRKLLRLCVSSNAATDFSHEAERRGLDVEIMKPDAIGSLLPASAVHQGVALLTVPLDDVDIGELLAENMIVMLDQVTDPHNVGAILRSSAAFGAGALVMTRRNSPAASGALAKAASGALEHVKIAHVANLARAIDKLGRMGFVVIGLDGEAERPLEDLDEKGPLALVLGAEGDGLRRLTREKCDYLCKINTCGPLSSLNVSNAAAIALHSLAFGRLGNS
jgi:23S rRNA (guanosine2251-2'-O)-methyltransferase